MMSETFEEHEAQDALSAAWSLTESVKTAEGYDELCAAIATRYAERGEFERGVEIADTMNDPYARDKMLADIAVRCASEGDEDYAFELLDSLEDFSHQATAMTSIAHARATRGDFARATEIASGMEDNSSVLAEIASLSAAQGDFERALDIAGSIDFPLYRALALTRIAGSRNKFGEAELAADLLATALEEALDIETDDERATTRAEIALRLSEAGQDEEAAAALAQALEDASIAEEPYNETALAQIAASHARLGQYDVALEVAEKINDVSVAAETLISLAEIERAAGREEEALQLLDDARELLSDEQPETQSEEARRRGVLVLLAVRYAEFGAAPRAMQVAQGINPQEERNRALFGIAVRAAEAGERESSLQAAREIVGDGERINALLRISRSLLTKDAASVEGEQTLAEAIGLIEQSERPVERAMELAEAATVSALAGKREQSARLLRQALTEAKQISGGYEKASALLLISDAYGKTGHDVDEEARELLWQITAV